MNIAGRCVILAEDLSPRSVPRQRRAIERRQAILDATLELLAEQSVDALSTSLIAKRARVPVASVYGYFPNKMAVIAALMRDEMDRVDTQLETLMPPRAEPARVAHAIDRAIDTIIAGYRASPARQRLFSAVHGNEALEPVARASDARMVEVLTQTLMQNHPGLPPLRARAKAQTAVQTFTALQEGAIACEEPAMFDALVDEWRIMVKAYLLPLTNPNGPPN